MVDKLPFPSNLKTDGFPLNKGLNFYNAPSFSEAGDITDCLNYAKVDGDGLQRIWGFIKSDGSALPKEPRIYYIEGTIVAANPSPGNALYVNGKKVPFGYFVVSHTTSGGLGRRWYFVMSEPSYAPSGGETVFCVDSTSNFLTNVSAPYIWNNTPSNALFDATFPTLNSSFYSTSSINEAYYINQYLYNYNYFVNRLDTNSGFLSGGSTVGGGMGDSPHTLPYCATININGAFEVKDKKYIATDAIVQSIDSLTRQIYPGDYILSTSSGSVPDTLSYGSSNVFLGKVLKTTLVSGSWTGATLGDVAVLEILPLGEFPNSTSYAYNNNFSSFSSISNTNMKFNSARSWNNINNNIYIYVTRDMSLIGGKNYTGISRANGVSAAKSTYLPTTGIMATLFSEEDAYNNTGIQNSVIYTATTGSTQYKNDDTPLTFNGTGTGADGQPIVLYNGATGPLAGIVITNPGTGYSSSPISGSTSTVSIDSTAATGRGGGGAPASLTYNAADWRFAGIRFIDTGWNVNYSSGNKAQNFLTTIDRNKLTSNATTAASNTSVTSTRSFGELDFSGAQNLSSVYSTQTSWIPSTGSVISCVSSSADGTYISQPLIFTNADSSSSITGGVTRETPSIGFFNFSSLDGNIPDDAQILGVEVVVSLETSAAWTTHGEITSFRVRGALIKTTDSTAVSSINRVETRLGDFKYYNIDPSAALVQTNVSLGGSTDLWANTYISKDDLINDGFGIALDAQVTRQTLANNATTVTVKIHAVTLNVYYDSPTSKYYFSNAGKTEVLSGDLLHYCVTEGSLRNSDAKGILTVVNLKTITGTSCTIKNNYIVYRDSGLTNQIATISADMVYNGVETYKTITDAKSRYTYCAANFYGNASYDAIYIASGAGRAKEFNGRYLCPIYAIPPTDSEATSKDIPRHIEYFNGRLALGYAAGSVLVSSVGDPRDFSGIRGAAEFSFGDRVTGLARLFGGRLGVFCQQSIHQLSGSSEANFTQENLSPKLGCIEYSLQNIQDDPVFCTSVGIRTLSQTQKYGDFIGISLSKKYNNWLLPRLNKNSPATAIAKNGGFVASYVSKKDNQYRLWFKDGFQLWVYLNPDGVSSEATIIKYYNGDPTKYLSYTSSGLATYNSNYSANNYFSKLVPNALLSYVDSKGNEQIYFSPDQSYLWSAGYSLPGVYRIDCTYGFEGGAYQLGIPAYIKCNYNNIHEPFNQKTIKKVRVENLTKNLDFIKVAVGKQYETLAATNYSNLSLQPLQIPGDFTINSNYILQEGFQGGSTITGVAKTGRVLQLLFINVPTVDDGSNYTIKTVSDYGFSNLPYCNLPTPPHSVQAVLLQYESGAIDA